MQLIGAVQQNRIVPRFEAVVDEYDAARPPYPPDVLDALGDLDGLSVLDVGAGTGIATRQLLQRGAGVIAVDPGERVLCRAVDRTPGLAAVVADGACLPVPDQAADLVCFAQSWHWLDETTRVHEAHRVLRDGGRWAGWWSHARADAEQWFDDYWAVIEASCPGTHRGQRDTDWGATVDVAGMFVVAPLVVVPWTRSISTEEWLTDQASHSYVAGLDIHDRDRLLAQLRHIVEREFGFGTMTVRYETWLWTATKAP